MSDNVLKKYLFQPAIVRSQIVKMTSEWQRLHQLHPYPKIIQETLGELVAAAILLASNLKFDGMLVLQIQGDGPVGLLVVECQANLSVRATVKLRADQELDPTASFQTLMNANGNGRFAVILDPYHKVVGQQPYQGVVALEGHSVAAVLEHYMRNSEQLETRLVLAANESTLGGVLLQKMPQEGGDAVLEPADDWNRLGILLDTLTPEELITENPDTIMHRLFHQEKVHALAELPVQFQCRCSRERVSQVIQMLGKEEVDAILEEKGAIQIQCDYCLTDYHFDAVDASEIIHQYYAETLQHSQNTH